MIDTCLEMPVAMKSEFLLIREVEAKLYGLRCTKHGNGFEVALRLGNMEHIFRSGDREAMVFVTSFGDYTVNYTVNGEYYPPRDYKPKTFKFEQCRQLVDEIIEFFHSAHRIKSQGVEHE